MLRRRFLMNSVENPDFTITYYAPQHIPFLHTYKRLLYSTDPLCDTEYMTFNVVLDTWSDGIGTYGIKITNNVLVWYNFWTNDIKQTNLETFLYGCLGVCESPNSVNYDYSNTITDVIFSNGIQHLECPIVPGKLIVNTSIVNATLPNDLHTLGDEIFEGLKGLQQIDIPESVINIGNHIVSIGFPNDVITNTERTNTSLQEIVLRPTIPPITSSTSPINIINKSAINSDFKIKVYADCIDTYKNDAVWGQYSDLYDAINNVIIYYKNSKHNSSFENTIHNYYDDIKRGLYLFNNDDVISLNSKFFNVNDIYITKECNIDVASANNRPSTIFIKTSKYYSDNDCIIENNTNNIIVGNNRLYISPMATTINNFAFCNVQTDARITIPENITLIHPYALYNCTIDDLEINANKDVFIYDVSNKNAKWYLSQCSIRNNIYISDCERYYTTNHELGIYGIIRKHDNTLIKAGAKDIISTNVLKIDGAYAYNDSIIEINIPDNIIEIQGAFQECKNLKHVTLSNNLTTIGDGSFSGCKSLNDINLPDSVTTILNNVFDGCHFTNFDTNKVESIGYNSTTGFGKFLVSNLIIRKSLKTIASSLGILVSNSIIVDEDNEYYKSENNCLIRKEDNALFVISKATNTIPYGIKSLESSSVSNRNGDIYMPNTIDFIKSGTFSNSSLNIYYDGTINQWNNIEKENNWNFYAQLIIHCTDGDIEI